LVSFGIQVNHGAGPGAWSTALGTVSCLSIFFLALKKGDRKFRPFDWACLGGAVIAFILWRVSNQPIAASVLLSLANVFGFLPTYRKGYTHPHEEGLSPFTIGGLGAVLAILALEQRSITTWLYPATIVTTNIIFVILILVRRKSMVVPATA
jgi:hypothetical protein